MIRFEQVSVTYPGATRPALLDVDLDVEEGSLGLVVGPTGAGKSTLLRAACGLVPHFSGGLLTGRVEVAGRDTRTHLPRDLADVVGVVLQDPAAGFVTETVEAELAYGMEQLGLPPATMRRRVEEVLDLMGLAPLRHRALADLSGGEQQRTAIGAVLTSHPRVLVLDEPTSALDPGAAEEVLAALTRLVHDLGLTVLVAEHRLERVVQYADTVLVLDAHGRVAQGAPEAALVDSPVAPPIVELGRLVGWRPLPLSVRDARRRAGDLRERLAAPRDEAEPSPAAPVTPAAPGTPAVPLLEGQRVEVRHGPVHAVRGVDVTLGAGEVVALMGRNGSGKSSLLWALQGSGRRSGGRVLVPGPDGTRLDPHDLSPAQARRHVALVPQNPRDLLYLESVREECRAADGQAGVPAGTTAALLDTLGGGSLGTGVTEPGRHPRDLSEGQQLTLALAVQLVAGARVLLLDEPTRGLDYAAKRRLGALLRRHTAGGGAVLLATHDVEFAAECAGRVVVLADGDVVADGPAHEVLVSSPTFAPQVARILHPLPLLTVGAVRDLLVTP